MFAFVPPIRETLGVGYDFCVNVWGVGHVVCANARDGPFPYSRKLVFLDFRIWIFRDTNFRGFVIFACFAIFEFSRVNVNLVINSLHFGVKNYYKKKI